MCQNKTHGKVSLCRVLKKTHGKACLCYVLYFCHVCTRLRASLSCARQKAHVKYVFCHNVCVVQHSSKEKVHKCTRCPTLARALPDAYGLLSSLYPCTSKNPSTLFALWFSHLSYQICVVLRPFTDDCFIWNGQYDQDKKLSYQSYLSRHYLPSEKKQSIRAAQTSRQSLSIVKPPQHFTLKKYREKLMSLCYASALARVPRQSGSHHIHLFTMRFSLCSLGELRNY